MNTQVSATKSNGTAPFVNISAYKFVRLDDLAVRRDVLLDLCQRLGLKGTILLSHEGINIFVAGMRDRIDALKSFFDSHVEYQDLPVKESESEDQPFTRMLVRIKKEIIAFGVDGIEPAERTSPKLKPQDLKRWLDEGKKITLLDVRNDYEVDLGTFDNAVPIGVDNFRDFPEAVEKLPDAMKDETVVMFCTGGIRCEKAGPFMEREGFTDIYQLDGGILKYFEDCGGTHYDGECFVFDKRVAVDAELTETGTQQCFACQHPLTPEDQASEDYVVGQSCSYCVGKNEEQLSQRLKQRNVSLQNIINPLPGSMPYDNHRPMNVPLRFDGQNILEFLTGYHPHVDSGYWSNEIETGRILYKELPVDSQLNVWAGQRLVHLLKGTVEPDVNANIDIVYEDDEMIVVNKPAPIAMHPCGRFNRNTVSYILNAVYQGEKIRMTHRLDANTTGVVVFARKRRTAQVIQAQFENGKVEKTYLARVHGVPQEKTFVCNRAISAEPGEGGLRLIDEQGLPARTDFELLSGFSDGTSLIKCVPKTGRTNQIRLHLWSLGLPILNDPSYLPDHQLGTNQTLKIEDEPMCLHASRLVIEHPTTSERIELESPDPNWSQNTKG